MSFFLWSLLGLSLLEGIHFLLSYVSTKKAFPQPLKPEQEREYLTRMAEGDREARNKLIEHNLRLVAHIAKKYDNTSVDQEDLISIGSIGLIKAIQTFDLNRKAQLATYAARCIENEILMYLRTTRKIKKEVHLYQPIGSDREGNEISLVDILGTAIDYISKQVELSLEEEKLYEKLEHLDFKEEHVIRQRYGLDNGHKKTQREIASELGISRSYVSRIEKKAVQKLYHEFLKEGY